ncbi:hypothetical protein [Hymenobacter guriensis]|uniref:Uncharacterized protein n=1 Tax=Hymenobacter guriensis TaxID=2793065 RepID=A0ABS0L9F9_9BACT|nr:hypothetical protein [Hymenobacter guriensis]MBG8556303.1 hypothetical protein [Hymenobacter guriensis]
MQVDELPTCGRSRLFTWMVRVCCNQAIDAIRNPSLDLPSVPQAPAQRSFNPKHIGERELLLHLKPVSARSSTCSISAAAPRRKPLSN